MARANESPLGSHFTMSGMPRGRKLTYLPKEEGGSLSHPWEPPGWSSAPTSPCMVHTTWIIKSSTPALSHPSNDTQCHTQRTC